MYFFASRYAKNLKSDSMCKIMLMVLMLNDAFYMCDADLFFANLQIFSLTAIFAYIIIIVIIIIYGRLAQ